MRRHRFIAGGVGLIIATAALAAPSAGQDLGRTVVAKGLNNPRGLAFGPGGALYVAEAGKGGKKCLKDVGCFGYSASIARVTSSGVKRVATGLASGGGPDGSYAGGPTDVTLDTKGRPVAIFNGVEGAKGLPAKAKRQLARLARVGGTRFTSLAKIDSIEHKSNPDKQDVNSNPYGVERIGDTYYVIDAGGNDVLAVKGGKISVAAVIPNPAPKVQPVPTSITAGPDGALYISELAPGPGVGQVVRLVPGQAPTIVASGLPSATGIAVGADRSIYLSTFGTGGEETAPNTGTVIKIAPDGTQTQIASALNYPAGMALGPDGDLYVSNSSVLPGKAATKGPLKGLAGEVVKINLP